MINLILQQVKYVLTHFKVTPIQLSGLIGFDFNPDQRRSYLMRVCFAPLTSFFLFAVLAAFYFNPWRYQFTLAQSLGIDNVFVRVLFGENIWTTLLLVILFLVLSLTTYLELLWIGLIGLLVCQGDIHIEISILSICAVFYGRSLRNFYYLRQIEGLAKLTWKFLSVMTFISHSIVVYIVINILQYLIINKYFASSMYANRYEFFILSVALFYGVEISILSIWGHFYNRRIVNLSGVSQHLVRFSTYCLVDKAEFRKQEKTQLLFFLESHLTDRLQFQKKDLDLIPKRIVELHQREESYLKQAISALR